MAPAVPALGRRALGFLSGAMIVAGCTAAPAAQEPPAAGARPRPPQGDGGEVVRPLPMPCADRPGDIVGLLLEGTGAPAGTVVVFGQAFRPGDLPQGTGLAARLAAGGRTLPVQLDVTTRHTDGSALFGIVAIAAPALRPGEHGGVVLSRGTTAGTAAETRAPVRLAEALAGRGAVVEVTPVEGGEPWRADLLALLAGSQPGRPWQDGPLAVQVRVAVPVPRGATGGVASLRLVADIAARADGSLWVDAWLRNDVAMRPDGGQAAYVARLLLDGREALRMEVPEHRQYTAWGRQAAAMRGGAAAVAPPHVRHDPAYLADTAAVMPYDLTTGVSRSVFNTMARIMDAPDWATPFGRRGIDPIGRPGASPNLGLTTLWQAAWLITGDPRAAAFSVGQAEASGGLLWHLWDPAGGADGKGGWMDERRWPRFWSDPRGAPHTLRQAMAGRPGGGPSASHQPNLSFVPYLLTGRRAFLDNLQAQSTWNVLSLWPAERGYDETGPARGILIVRGRQTRSAAWSMRQLNDASWISPDDDANTAYLREVAAANWAWLRARIPEWTAQQGELHGYVPPLNFGRTPNLSTWQQDYFASATAVAARRGNADARAFLDWMRNFLVGRFFAHDRGFSRHDAVAYQIALVPLPLPPAGQPSKPPFQSWAEVGEATRERSLTNGTGWRVSDGEYARLGLLSLAAVAEVFGDARALEAYRWLLSAGPPYTRTEDFARTPYHNIVPRGLPRIAANGPRCTAAR